MSTDELAARVANLERAFQMLVELLRRSDERADTHLEWINALGKAQAESEAKIAALADAQIKTEDAIGRLTEGQQRRDERDAAIDERVNALVNVVERLISDKE